MLHRNLGLKAASLVLAIFLWFWVTLGEETPLVRRSVDVDIRAEGVGPKLVAELAVPQVTVTVRGLEHDVGGLEGQVIASVTCRGLGVGTHYLPIRVRVPQAVALVSIRPATVPVMLDSMVSERRKVEVKLVGEPLGSFAVKGAEALPPEVVVSGPRNRVERAVRVVATAELSRMIPGVPATTAARALDETGRVVEGVSLDPARVKVKAIAERVVVAKTVPVVLRTAGSLPAGWQLVSVAVEPPMVTLLVSADRADSIASIGTEELRLGSVRGSITRALGLVEPAGASLVDGGKVRVALRVERASPEPR
ncbi:MAG: YbbR-like domain-containing protein [Armatimonadota bacterium]